MCALTARITSVRTIAVRGIIITVIIADFRFDLNLTETGRTLSGLFHSTAAVVRGLITALIKPSRASE
jgi:hypothetical protein